MSLNQKAGRLFFMITGMLMLVAALLVWGGPAMEEESLPAPAEVAFDAKSAPCKGLKAFNNLDELLYQLHINLESDCLYKMDPKELAKIWRIPTIIHSNTRGSLIEERAPAEGDHDYLRLNVFKKDDGPIINQISIQTNYSKGSANHSFTNVLEHLKLPPEQLVCVKPMPHLAWFSSDKTRVMLLLVGDGQMTYILMFESMPLTFFENCYSYDSLGK